MSSDDDGVFAGQQHHDVALTVFAFVLVGLSVLALLVVFAPPRFLRWSEPLVRPFGARLFGVAVWQLAAASILAVGSWLLVVDIQND